MLQFNVIDKICRYIAAKRCEKAMIDVMNGAKNNDEKMIIDTYPNLLIESKALVIHLAKLMNKTPNVSAIERYGISDFLWFFWFYKTFIIIKKILSF